MALDVLASKWSKWFYLVMSGVGCFANKMVEMVLPCNECRWMFRKQNGRNGFTL